MKRHAPRDERQKDDERDEQRESLPPDGVLPERGAREQEDREGAAEEARASGATGSVHFESLMSSEASVKSSMGAVGVPIDELADLDVALAMVP